MELVVTTSTGQKLSMDIEEDHIFLQLGGPASHGSLLPQTRLDGPSEGERVDIFLDSRDITPAVRAEAMRAKRSIEQAIGRAASKLQDAILSEAV